VIDGVSPGDIAFHDSACGVASADVIGHNIFCSLCRVYIHIFNVGYRRVFAFVRDICDR
jgi:uncharacterized Fe-S cluster-containing radical SAM superfamily protein